MVVVRNLQRQTYIGIVCPAKHVGLIWLPPNHIRPARAKPRILRVIRHKLVLETEIGIHAQQKLIKKAIGTGLVKQE